MNIIHLYLVVILVCSSLVVNFNINKRDRSIFPRDPHFDYISPRSRRALTFYICFYIFCFREVVIEIWHSERLGGWR